MKIDNKTKLLYPLIIFGVFLTILSVLFFSTREDRNINVKEFTGYDELQIGEKLPISFGPNLGFPPGWNMPSYEFDGNFPEMPEKMMIYKLVPSQPLTENDIMQMGQLFDIPSIASFESREISYVLKTDTLLLDIEKKTGFLNFEHRRKANEQYSTNRDDYPGDDECKKIATEFLNEKGLWEDDTVFSGITDSANFSHSSNGAVDVWFGSQIGGYKTFGIGRKIKVGVGSDGTVQTILKQWIKVEPWKIAPIKTPKEAFKELKEGKAYFADIDIGKIDEITIRYFTQDFQRGYIAPVYYFSLKKSGGTAILVPAVRSEYIMSDEQMKEMTKKSN